MLDEIQTSECRAEIDTAKDHLRDLGVSDTGSIEHNSAVVEEVISTGQLLEGL